MGWCTALMTHLQRTVDELQADEQKSTEAIEAPAMSLSSPKQQAVI